MPPLTVRELLRLAVPSMVFAVLTFAFRSVDQLWIQWVSTEAQAAIGSSVFVVIAMLAAFELPALGAAPLIARATGAGDAAGRRAVLGSALAATLLITAGLMAAGLAGAGAIGATLGLSGETAADFHRYLGSLCLTLPPLALTPLVDSSFIAMGNTRTPMLLQGLCLAANVVLTPLFIYPEIAGVPGLDLGIAGAALASNLSRALSTGLGGWLLIGETGLGWADARPGPSLRRIFRIGAPLSAGTLIFAVVYQAMLRTSVSPLGPEVNAALGIGFSALEGVTWPAFHGLSLAVSSIVGRALGAGQPERAWAAVRLAFPLLTAAGIVAWAAFLFGGPWLTGLFTEDPLVHERATEYAAVLAWSQLFVAYESLTEGVLGGAGDSRTLFLISVPLNLARVPLAWALAFPVGLGAAGIWWAVNLSTYAKVALKVAAVWQGRWVTLEV